MSGIDATIIVAYLLAMVGVGVWFMRRNKSADDYFRGGGRLPWWVVSLSIYATLFSSITFLSIPALTYHTDCRYFFKTFGILILVPIVVKFYLPFFRKLNLTSAYEYLEVRFNLGCRLFASAAFILFMIARTGVVAYLPAVAISAVTGIDVNMAIVIVTLITIVYCTIGGVEAVVWSDFVQSVILIGSTVAIYAYLVCGTDGGLSGFLAKGIEAGKFRMMDFGWDWAQPVLWVTVVGGIVENLASYTSDQSVVQRYMTCKDEVGAAKSIKLNGVLSFVNCFVFFTLGVALWTFYQSHADKIPTLAKQDQIFPWFIAHELPVGFSGLVLAAVAAATMSTLSANLNSAASAVTTDFYQRLKGGGAGERRNLLRCGKIVTMAVGLLGGALALVLANMGIGSVYDQFLKFLGVLTGGLACLFLMGRFMPFVNGRGAFVGLVANYVVCFSLDLVPFAHKPHILLYGFFGIVACLIVAPIASLGCREKGAPKCC
ncbi:MAG: sodium:solute symporter [Kiritimatiellae bacterium]|nr:sodium:solute symporter [Kiritimatiellia bacterium]